MASSIDKASALKNSYVDGILDELGGTSDPAVRMALRGSDIASVHAFPDEGKLGGINDGDPTMYIHGRGQTIPVSTDEKYANPLRSKGPGGRTMGDADPDANRRGIQLLDEIDRRMGGTGNFV